MSNTKLNSQPAGKTKLKIFKNFPQTKLRILYEDNHLIAVEKPHGIPVQADESKDPCLMDEVKKYLREKYQKPGNVFLGLLHRLDRPVRGIILFAKTSKGASRLSEQFRNYTVQKIYHAFTENRPPKNKATLVHYLQKDHKKNIVKAFNSPGPNRQKAELDYEIEKKSLSDRAKKYPEAVPVASEASAQDARSAAKCTLISTAEGRTLNAHEKEVKPASPVRSDRAYKIIIHLKTGRSHQIRAQLSAIGCSILGDLKYGAKKPLPDKSIALTATSLTFTTATGEKTITLEIKPENPHAHRTSKTSYDKTRHMKESQTKFPKQS